MPVLRRPLAYVLALTLGDYVLWNWSLNGNHYVLALVSGLTLPPLALVLVWLLALSAARLIARSTSPTSRRRDPARSDRRSGAAPTRSEAPVTRPESGPEAEPREDVPATARSARSSSGKLAA